jgi:citrate synthase
MKVDAAGAIIYTAAMEHDQSEFLTVKEATALLGVKPATLYAYVSRGVLRSYRLGVGRQRLYRRADVEALLAVRADAPSPRHPDPRSPRQVAEAGAGYTAPAPPPDDDRTLRDVSLPDVASWAGDH